MVSSFFGIIFSFFKFSFLRIISSRTLVLFSTQPGLIMIRLHDMAQKYYTPPQTMPKKTTKVSSRLAKSESKKAMKQTVLFIIASVILLFFFLFVIIPVLIRLISTGEVGQLTNSDDIPPQVPSIVAPVEATSSASIVIEGYGEPESEAVLVLNGSEVGRGLLDAEQGKFEYELFLEEGDNTLSLYGVDQAGNESALTTSYSITYDNVPPEIELETPEDGQQFELRKNQNITIKGVTEPRSYVYINGRRSIADGEGVFSSRMQLEEGDNTITIVAEDPAKNTSEKEIIVKFKY